MTTGEQMDNIVDEEEFILTLHHVIGCCSIDVQRILSIRVTGQSIYIYKLHSHHYYVGPFVLNLILHQPFDLVMSPSATAFLFQNTFGQFISAAMWFPNHPLVTTKVCGLVCAIVYH